MNSAILILHVSAVCSLTLIALRFKQEAIIAWLSLLAVAMNLFVLKQITLFGLEVTASDALVVGYLLGLNLIQEFFGQTPAKKCVWISFFVSCGFIVLSQIHLRYLPNIHDKTHAFFALLLNPMPRILFASFFAFIVVQFFDITFFNFLRKKTSGKYLLARITLAILLSQTLDTLLFSFIGLYGIVASLTHVILFSLVIKIFITFVSIPFLMLAKKVIPNVQV